MAMSAGIQEQINSVSDMLEEAVIPRLISNRKLSAVRHEGTWYPVDSPKDLLHVNCDVKAGNAAWRRWQGLELST